MRSTEYTTLVKDGEVVQKILPNVEFDSIAGGCKVTAYARVIDGDNQIFLKPGSTTPEVKELLPTGEELTIKELKHSLRDAGISFPSKAKREVLLELLKG